MPKQTPARYIILLYFKSEYAFHHHVLIWLHFVQSNSRQSNRTLLFKPTMPSALFILLFTHLLFTFIYNSPVVNLNILKSPLVMIIMVSTTSSVFFCRMSCLYGWQMQETSTPNAQ